MVRFLKGHGTENDFVLLPDPDGAHTLTPERVRALTDRRAGIGGDGVLRIVRTTHVEDAAGHEAQWFEAQWFMDYRNADGSISEMCGNGVRLVGRYLVDYEGADPGRPLPIATRAGVKWLDFEADGQITVDMGPPQLLGETTISVGERSWPACRVSMGNPHAVVWVDDLAEAGSLTSPPLHDASHYPDGVNVEFVRRLAPRRLSVRVHERGSGETRSCGTGACAVGVVAAEVDGAARGTAYDVELPGGTLRITRIETDRVLMTGPAVMVAEGETSL